MNNRVGMGGSARSRRVTRKIVAVTFASVLVLGLAGCQASGRESMRLTYVRGEVADVVVPASDHYGAFTADRMER